MDLTEPWGTSVENCHLFISNVVHFGIFPPDNFYDVVNWTSKPIFEQLS